jgi:hypothetical protein
MSSLSSPAPAGVTSKEQLDFLEQALRLSETQLGALFGVSRQAVSEWRERGVPARRTAQIDRVVEFVQFLRRRLIPERIPEIVRTKARGLDQHTMLEVLHASGPGPLYRYVASLSAYANA